MRRQVSCTSDAFALSVGGALAVFALALRAVARHFDTE